MKMQMQRTLSKRSYTILSFLFIGICAASTGFLAAFLSLTFYMNIIIHQSQLASPLENVLLFYGSASLAALLTGSFFWWYGVLKSGQDTVKRGVIVGIVISVIAHPVTWLIAGLITYFSGIPIFSGLSLNSPFDALINALFISIFSLLYVGWLTALIGGIMGAVLMLAQRADEHI